VSTAVGDVLSAVNTVFRGCVESIEQSRVVIACSGQLMVESDRRSEIIVRQTPDIIARSRARWIEKPT